MGKEILWWLSSQHPSTHQCQGRWCVGKWGWQLGEVAVIEGYSIFSANAPYSYSFQHLPVERLWVFPASG